VIGSPYAVVDYHCNPQLGTDDDLRNFRKRLNDMGLYLMLDFVPNVRGGHHDGLALALTLPTSHPPSTRPWIVSGQGPTPTSLCVPPRARQSPTLETPTTPTPASPMAAVAGEPGSAPPLYLPIRSIYTQTRFMLWLPVAVVIAGILFSSIFGSMKTSFTIHIYATLFLIFELL